MRKSTLMAVVPVTALLAAACGSSASKTTTHAKSSTSTAAASGSSSAGKITITSRTVKPYGAVLVNGAGHTLYIFAPDKAKKVTCLSACAQIWPPVKLTGSAKPAAAGQVKASLLSSATDPSGGRVVTYKGWPLYAYVSDTAPGVAHGQGVNSAGGLWYVISPSGTVIKSKASSSSAPKY